MKFKLNSQHELVGVEKILGRSNENFAETVEIELQDASLSNHDAYLEFETFKGYKMSTPKLEIVNNIIKYKIPSFVLDEGISTMQLVLRKIDEKEVWKSEIKRFYVTPSINVDSEYEHEYVDFISNAQDILDKTEIAADKIINDVYTKSEVHDIIDGYKHPYAFLIRYSSDVENDFEILDPYQISHEQVNEAVQAFKTGNPVFVLIQHNDISATDNGGYDMYQIRHYSLDESEEVEELRFESVLITYNYKSVEKSFYITRHLNDVNLPTYGFSQSSSGLVTTSDLSTSCENVKNEILSGGNDFNANSITANTLTVDTELILPTNVTRTGDINIDGTGSIHISSGKGSINLGANKGYIASESSFNIYDIRVGTNPGSERLKFDFVNDEFVLNGLKSLEINGTQEHTIVLGSGTTTLNKENLRYSTLTVNGGKTNVDLTGSTTLNVDKGNAYISESFKIESGTKNLPPVDKNTSIEIAAYNNNAFNTKEFPGSSIKVQASGNIAVKGAITTNDKITAEGLRIKGGSDSNIELNSHEGRSVLINGSEALNEDRMNLAKSFIYTINNSRDIVFDNLQETNTYNLNAQIQSVYGNTKKCTVTEGDPTYFVGLQSVQFEGLTVYGKNLWCFESNHLTSRADEYLSRTGVKVRSNTTYTLSFDVLSDLTINGEVSFELKQINKLSNNSIDQNVAYIKSPITLGKNVLTLLLGEGAGYLYVKISQPNVQIENIQIEANSISTNYKPYRNPIEIMSDMNITLRSVEDIKDEIKFEKNILGSTYTSTLIKRVRAIDLGTFNWLYDSTKLRFYTEIPSTLNIVALNSSPILTPKYTSNHIRTINDYSLSDVIYFEEVENGNSRLCVQDHTYTNVTDFKLSITNQMACCQLREPIVTTLYSDLTTKDVECELEFGGYIVNNNNNNMYTENIVDLSILHTHEPHRNDQVASKGYVIEILENSTNQLQEHIDRFESQNNYVTIWDVNDLSIDDFNRLYSSDNAKLIIYDRTLDGGTEYVYDKSSSSSWVDEYDERMQQLTFTSDDRIVSYTLNNTNKIITLRITDGVNTKLNTLKSTIAADNASMQEDYTEKINIVNENIERQLTITKYDFAPSHIESVWYKADNYTSETLSYNGGDNNVLFILQSTYFQKYGSEYHNNIQCNCLVGGKVAVPFTAPNGFYTAFLPSGGANNGIIKNYYKITSDFDVDVNIYYSFADSTFETADNNKKGTLFIDNTQVTSLINNPQNNPLKYTISLKSNVPCLIGSNQNRLVLYGIEYLKKVYDYITLNRGQIGYETKSGELRLSNYDNVKFTHAPLINKDDVVERITQNIGTLREDTNMNTALINTKVNQTDYDTFKSQVDSYHAQHTTEYNELNGKVNSILEGSSIDADSFKEVVDIINNADANLVNQIAQKVNTSDIVNDLHSLDTNKPLSAYQGKVLNDSVESLQFSVSDLRDMDSELRSNINELSTSVYERISVIKDETIPSMQSQIEQNRIDALDAYNYASDNDSWLNNLQNQVNSLSDQINITYAELKVLRDTSNLEIGKKYRITDFVTTCAIQRDCQSAGHPFDIIVTANDINVLDENASAICHSGDTYFAESKLESWNIKYCLDNDRRRFNWADETNGKGVIWYMKDQFNNECYYDFKNIQYKRWNILSVNDAKNSIFVNNKFYYGNYDIYGEEGNSQIIEGEYGEFKWVYTFHNVYDDSDLSLKNLLSKEYVDYLEYEYGEPTDWFAHDNSIGSNHHQYYEEYDSDYNGESMSLPNNVFYGEAYFLDDYSDICVTGIHGNKLGVNCYSNTFGNSCYYNTFGNYCNSNTFGNYCDSNTFGNSCHSNTFGNSCHSNTFGNSCNYNTFGNSCHSNTFGNSCHSNTFGNYCYSNKIFNDVLQTSINSYARWNIFENGVTYVTLQSSTGGAYNSQLQNVKICQGVKGASSSNRKVINVSRNLPYQYEVKAVNSVTSEV